MSCANGAEATVGLGPIPDEDLGRMLLIRHFEQVLLDCFSKGTLSGTTHTCMGQEYIPVALSSMLRPTDFIFSNHRGHGHYLSRFDDPAGLLAEIMGRRGAVCNGVGGSQHIFRDHCYASTGVQGESLPVAVGVALHFKRRGDGSIVVVHIGDGTWGEGTVYEALNLASLWKLPVCVVVEHNGISQTTPTELQMAGTIEGRARGFGIAHRTVVGHDVAQIRASLGDALAEVRSSSTPLVLEFETVRIGPHSKGDDTRPADQIEACQQRDWYAAYRAQFPDQFARQEAVAVARVRETLAQVEASPPVEGMGA